MGKHNVGVFFNKVPDLQALIKKRLQRRCFPVKFAKFLRAPILKNMSRQLLLGKLRVN